MRDAFVLAARLDYAVAANLNLALSLFRADRTSHGYSWACIGPNAGVGAFPGTPDGNIDLNLNRYPGSPNIPDGSLGTEIGLSMDWKLLEGLVLGINAAYWKPGAWFTLRMRGSICSGLGNRHGCQSLRYEAHERDRSCSRRPVCAYSRFLKAAAASEEFSSTLLRRIKVKKLLINLFIFLFVMATGSLLSNADEAAIAQSQELSPDRHADQKGRKDVHRHDVKPKSKYDLRYLDGDRGGDSHKHARNHDHKAKSKYDLRSINRHDHRKGHIHEQGHAHKHDHGDAHKHDHVDAHVHDHGNGPGSHDDHGHQGHGHDHGHGGHDHGHGGHEHGYDRIWDVGISG